MKPKPLYEHIATETNTLKRNIESGNTEWEHRRRERIKQLEHLLPSGSGFDMGTVVCTELSTDTELILESAYHHMDSGGGYYGWTNFRVVLTPSLEHGYNLDIDVLVTPRGFQYEEQLEPQPMADEGWKEYVVDTFESALSETYQLKVINDDLVRYIKVDEPKFWSIRERCDRIIESDNRLKEYLTEARKTGVDPWEMLGYTRQTAVLMAEAARKINADLP